MQPFFLSNFKGPLELLLLLIQKQELDIFDIMVKEITDQFLQATQDEKTVDLKAEFLPLASALLILKSRKLLPKEGKEEEIEEEMQLRLDLLTKLLQYSQFKDFAEKLLQREEEESAYFLRKVPDVEKSSKPKTQEIDLFDLTSALEEIIKKSAKRTHIISSEDEWEIEPRMAFLKQIITDEKRCDFYELFSPQKSKNELIVLFLALLELMKQQILKIEKSGNSLWISEKT